MAISHHRIFKEHHRVLFSWQGRREVVHLGVVGSFYYARLNKSDLPFDFVMQCFTEAHVWMTKEGWKPGKHEAHHPCVIEGTIIKNWECLP